MTDAVLLRALHGDIVVVDIQEPSEWRSRDREHNTARRAIAADLDTAAQDAAEGPPLEDIVAALAVSAGKRVVDATDETDADASDAYKLWRPIVATRGVEAQGADVLTAGAEVEDEVDEAGADGGAAPGRFIAHVDTDLGVLPPSTAAYKANVERVQAVAKRVRAIQGGLVCITAYFGWCVSLYILCGVHHCISCLVHSLVMCGSSWKLHHRATSGV